MLTPPRRSIQASSTSPPVELAYLFSFFFADKVTVGQLQLTIERKLSYNYQILHNTRSVKTYEN